MARVSKEQGEKAVFDKFNLAYKKRFGHSLVNVKHQDRPDFVATDTRRNEIIGIEITSVYQNDTDARIQFSDIDYWDKFTGNLDDLIINLNCVLKDKAAKSKGYDFDGRLVLVIWFGSTAPFDKPFINVRISDIVVRENRFSNIWLLLRDSSDNSTELYDLQ